MPQIQQRDHDTGQLRPPTQSEYNAEASPETWAAIEQAWADLDAYHPRRRQAGAS